MYSLQPAAQSTCPSLAGLALLTQLQIQLNKLGGGGGGA